jgi:predicted dehydrogenase
LVTARPIRVGVIGAGRWAVLHHLPGLLSYPATEVVAIAEPDAERRRLVAERFQIKVAVPTSEELIDTKSCDAVVISSPPAAHHAAAAVAIAAGLHVLVEKPMVPTAAEAWDLVERAERAGVTLMVGYTFQLTESAAVAQRVIADGEAGELRLVSGIYASAMAHLYDGDWPHADDPLVTPIPSTFADPAIAGGGQSQSQLTHLCGAMLGSTGLVPGGVSALFRPVGDPLDRHNALTVELGDAVAALASTGTLPAGSQPVWELRYFGDRGTLRHDLARGSLDIDRGRGPEILVASPASAEQRYPASAVARRFVDVVRDGVPNPAPGVLGAHATAIVDSAQRSAAQGGTLVPCSRS